jgi:hypothetical protein
MHLKAIYMSSLRPHTLVASGTHTQTYVRTIIPETKTIGYKLVLTQFFKVFFFDGSPRFWLGSSVVIFFFNLFLLGLQRFWLVSPVVGPLREWVAKQKLARLKKQQQQHSSSSSSSSRTAAAATSRAQGLVADAGACGEGDASCKSER